MTLLFSWFLMAFVQLAATMSPGPAFVVAVKNALAYGRKAGLATAFGLSLGVAAHVVSVLCGIAFVISNSVWAFSFIRYAGAAYLVYIGLKAIMSSFKRRCSSTRVDDGHLENRTMISLPHAIVMGFLTNLLNPKAVVFFTAVFTQFITPDTSFAVLALYGMTSVTIECLWFMGVAIVLTHAHIRDVFMSCMHWVDRVCGGLMIALGVKLALSKT